MTLGEIIYNYRKTNKLSMQEFADKSDISKAYISLLEKGVHPRDNKPITPSLGMIYKISKAMGITPDELVASLDGDTDIRLVTETVVKMVNASKKKIKLVEEIDMLTDEQVDKVLTFIEMIK